MMNLFYGSTLTDKTKFRDIRICTTKRQSLKFIKLPNFHSIKIINENLNIIELSKNKCVFSSPVTIRSEILFNSKCNLYNYMYNIIPTCKDCNATYCGQTRRPLHLRLSEHHRLTNNTIDSPNTSSTSLKTFRTP